MGLRSPPWGPDVCASSRSTLDFTMKPTATGFQASPVRSTLPDGEGTGGLGAGTKEYKLAVTGSPREGERGAGNTVSDAVVTTHGARWAPETREEHVESAWCRALSGTAEASTE